MYRMAKKSPYPYLPNHTHQYKHAMCCGGIKAHRLEIQKITVPPHIITFEFPSPHTVHMHHTDKVLKQTTLKFHSVSWHTTCTYTY